MEMRRFLAFTVMAVAVTAVIPTPNSIQSKFMDFDTIQFMHFGIPTFWDPPKDYLYGKNPTYHDCSTTTIDTGPQTKGYYPCLNPDVSSGIHTAPPIVEKGNLDTDHQHYRSSFIPGACTMPDDPE